MTPPSTPIRIFIAYAREDALLLEQVRKFLHPLEKDIKMWYDGKIMPGETWAQSIKDNLHAADIILLLMSADAISSNYFWEKEKADALARHHKGECKVVPIILKPCGWDYTDLADLQALPKDGKAITTWNNQEEALRSVFDGLVKLVKEIQDERTNEEMRRKRLAEEQAEAERLRKAAKERHEREADLKRQKEEQEQIRNQRQFWEQLQTADDLYKQQKYAQAQVSYEKLLNWQNKTALGYTDAQPHLVRRIQECKAEQQFADLRQQARQLHQKGKYALALDAVQKALQIKKDDRELQSLQRELEQRIQQSQQSSQQWIQRVAKGAGGLLLLLFFMKIVVPVGYYFVDSITSQKGTKPTSTTSTDATETYTETVAGINLQMTLVRGGTFTMGSNDGSDDEKPTHTVQLDDYFIGTQEVTLQQFRAFIADTGYKTDAEKRTDDYGSYIYNVSRGGWEKKDGINWRHDAEGKLQTNDQHPVIHISWNDAMAFCKWLKDKTGKNYTLPTEAQWEYAAGNGSRHTKYAWGNGNPTNSRGGNVADETKLPNGTTWDSKFEGYTDGYWATAPVGQFGANELGLYDMTGNVWEWCSDWYSSDYYSSSSSLNPTGPATGTLRALRGGGWCYNAESCRVVCRGGTAPASRRNRIGFRLAVR
jgi:formylglycine-generating enzyme required for sulfatase activity